MRLRLLRSVAGCVAVAVLCASVPVINVRADIEDTKEKIRQAEEEHQATTQILSDTKDNIDSLSNTKGTLEGQLHQLNVELATVSDNLAELEDAIEEKEEEIEQTTADLEEALRIEEAQYQAMKLRIRFMYEKQEFTYADMLFNSKSFSEFLNKNNYIEKLSEYDRRQLDRFKETRKNVEDTKAKLEGEKAELDAYHAEVAEQQAMVTGYVNATSSEIGRYSKEIKNFEAVADAYAAKAAEEEENIAALKKQLAEEIAMSKLAAQSKWRDISEVSFEDGDRMLLANLIYCEAGNQPYEGQLAVGAVVINRVLSSVYPDTVVGVIYQYKQFSPVGDGHLALALAEDRATSACYKAADEAMSGQTNVGNCVYFRTPIEGLSGIQIGAHIFY
ncbi:MAG: cell wall hydrolase [Lachnospiraceae bacterium]|nr:cell wall hydrolase [Lachnospiraceae bacterium]